MSIPTLQFYSLNISFLGSSIFVLHFFPLIVSRNLTNVIPSAKSVAKFLIYYPGGRYVLTQFIKYKSSPYFDIAVIGVTIIKYLSNIKNIQYSII